MNYNISKTTPPAMPKLGHGTECIALLLSQVSKDMHQPLVPMIFPILGAHLSGAEFMYPDLSWKEPCGMLANLVAESGAGKGQLSALVEAICRDFRQHDDGELSKLVEWQKAMKTKSPRLESCCVSGLIQLIARPGVYSGLHSNFPVSRKNRKNRMKTKKIYRNVSQRMTAPRPFRTFALSKRHPDTHVPITPPVASSHPSQPPP